MRRRLRLVGLLWRWHRRLGVLVACFALLLAITGIVLNHSADVGTGSPLCRLALAEPGLR